MSIIAEEKPFIYDFGEHNGIKSFNDKEDFIEFLGNEKNNYLWIKEFDSNLFQFIDGCFQKIIQFANKYDIYNKNFEFNLNNYRGDNYYMNMKEIYINKELPLSETKVFNIIEEIKNINPKIAVLSIRFWISYGFSLSNRDSYCAAIMISQYLSQIAKVPKSIRRELKSLSNEYNKKIADARRLHNTLISENEEMKKGLKSNIRSSYKKLRRREKGRVEDIGGRVAEAIKSIKETERTYKEYMRLKAPVEYWKEKQKEHENRAENWGGALFLFGIVGTLVLIAILWFLANHTIGLKADTPTPVYFIYATIAVTTTTIVFWCGRILSRVYLSQYHLALDAGERATMVQTYLALVNEGQAVEDDRTIVLGSLFRPTEDGIVKDDVAPDLSFAAILAKLGSKG